MEKLFSYGTLQQDQVQLDTFGRKLLGVPDQLVGYGLTELKIQDPAVLASSGKEIHPIVTYSGQPEDIVEGMVLDITSAELAQSDRYEVDDYTRVSVKLRSGTVAWVYVGGC